MNESTYIIDEEIRAVERFVPGIDTRKFRQDFDVLEEFKGLDTLRPAPERTTWRQWIAEDPGREVYLIARDELIERGLIKE